MVHPTSMSLVLTDRQICDVEMIMLGGFAPLTGFMNCNDYDSVVQEMRLMDGTVWPMPIVLDIPEAVAKGLRYHDTLLLKNEEGVTLATLAVEDIWQPDKQKEAACVYRTLSADHPGVDYLYNHMHSWYVGGPITPKQLPEHFDFKELRKTPAELKELFKAHGTTKVVGFQTRNPLHRAHKEITTVAAKQLDAHLLLHPVVGLTKPGDIDYVTRVKCYKKLLKYYDEGTVTLSLLPLAMRMAGPREALWHAIIRKNYGCTHFIVGRDHAGPGTDRDGNLFYDPYDAQRLVQQFEKEIGIEVVTFQEMVYVANEDVYKQEDALAPHDTVLRLSGTRIRALLMSGDEIPAWFSYPEIIAQLRKVYPPRHQQGFTLFFAGLSGAGKSTIARAVLAQLQEMQDRSITLLDGDVVRQNLSSELGYSKEHRSLNVRRVGFVAHEITKNGGIAICPLMAPYEADRAYNRSLISQRGGYIEIYVSTPLEVCQERDVKELYAKAKEGLVNNIPGLDIPFEVPQHATLTIDAGTASVDQAVTQIIDYLVQQGFIKK